MAWWVLPAVIAGATAAQVGVGVAGIVEGRKAANETVKNQEEWSLASAYVTYGQALISAPSSVPT